MEQVAVRSRLVEELMRHAERPDHPSHQLLDRVERSLASPEEAEAYVELLLSKSATAHPSLRMLDRAERTIRRIELARASEEAASQKSNDRKDHP